MATTFDHYLNDNFPGLELESPLFYNADIGIRFEIGDPDPFVSDEQYRQQVHLRATQLYKYSHSHSDNLYVVLITTVRKNRKPFKLNIFKKGVKSKNTLRKLICSHIQMSDEEDGEWVTIRYLLNCKAEDIKPFVFLFADFRVFIVNSTRNTIFYLYDSRGLDIVSNSKEPLQNLYYQFNHWILDHDREKIDSIFKL